MKQLSIFVDGAIGTGNKSGVAAVARTARGRFLGWLSRQLPQMTNNEAEYEAVLLGLKLARRLDAEEVEIVSDSEVVVRQMQGRSRVHSGRLKELHSKTCVAVRSFRRVRFQHVSREQNRLADALAAEAPEGREVCMGPRERPSGLRRLLAVLGRQPGSQLS